MCTQLGITRAAYYKWLHRAIPETEQENILLAQLIQEYDERFHHILGYRRMTAWINRFNGTHYSRNRIHRIMRVLKIQSAIRRKRKNYPKSAPERTAENLLKRDFTASRPNEKWTTDVTEFKWYDGPAVRKLYLSVILDLYDRSVVAWVTSTRNDNKLVFDTFEKAIRANPDAQPLFHSDRGFQYTSRVFQTKLLSQGMRQSMSRVGHCIDNGPTEGFWGILKSEMYALWEFHDKASLIDSIANYIEFYNTARPQERFRNLTPAEVRAAALGTEHPVQYPIPPNMRIQKYKAKYIA